MIQTKGDDMNDTITKKAIPRIRNMKEAFEDIQDEDPFTSITFFAFRRDVLNGMIPSRKNGRCYYVNMNDVWEYYSS